MAARTTADFISFLAFWRFFEAAWSNTHKARNKAPGGSDKEHLKTGHYSGPVDEFISWVSAQRVSSWYTVHFYAATRAHACILYKMYMYGHVSIRRHYTGGGDYTGQAC